MSFISWVILVSAETVSFSIFGKGGGRREVCMTSSLYLARTKKGLAFVRWYQIVFATSKADVKLAW